MGKSKLKLFIISGFLGILFSLQAVEWTKVDIDFKSAMVGKLHTYGQYQFALLRNHGGLYRRSVGEEQWREIISKGSFFPTDHLYYPEYKIVDPLFIEYGNSHLFVDDGSESYYSTDSGATWNKTDAKLNLYRTTISIGKTWYDSHGVTIRKTEGMGVIWEDFFTTNSLISSINSYGQNLWVGSWGEIYHWNTLEWDTLTVGLPERCAIGYLKQVNDSLVFAQTDLGLYSSNDTGNSWDLLNESFSNLNYNMVRDIEGLDSVVLLLTDKGIYRYISTDYSLTKVDVSFNMDIRIPDIDKFDNKFQLAGYDGIYESNDLGMTWKKYSDGLAKNYLKIGEVEVNDSILVVEIENSNFQSLIFKGRSDGSEMGRILTTVSTVQKINLHNNNIYVGDSYANINPYGPNVYMLYDTINSWKKELLEHHHLIGNFHTSGDTILSISGQKIHLSLDDGITWNNIHYGCPVNGYSKIGSRIIITNAQFNKFSTQHMTYTDNYFDSVNTYSDFDLKTRMRRHSGVYWHNDTLWTKNGENGSYIYSTDTATTWSDDSLFLPIDMSTLIEKDGILFVKHNYGLMYSIDNGTNWIEIKIPFSKLNLQPLKVNNKNLYISSEGEVYYTPLSSFKDPIPIFNKTTIQQNRSIRTNVINGKINLQMSLPTESAYRGTLINISGQKVKDFSGHANAGVNQIKLNCSDISKGYYILRIRVSGKVINKPILLSK